MKKKITHSKIKVLLSLNLIFFFSLDVVFAQRESVNNVLENRKANKEEYCLNSSKIESYKNHPDFGKVILKDSLGEKMDFVELMDKRDEYNAHFSIPNSDKSCVRSSDFPLHYKDQNGIWRNIETKLEKSSTNQDVYEIEKQTYPISYNSKTGETLITVDKKGNKLGTSKNVRFYQVDKNNNLITSSNINNVTTRKIETKKATIKNFFNNIDYIHEFEEYGAKSSFIIKDKSVINLSSKHLVFSEEIELPSGWKLKRDKENNQVLKIYDLQGNTKATILPPFYYDSFDMKTSEDKIDHHY
jgi:hypothetical protein